MADTNHQTYSPCMVCMHDLAMGHLCLCNGRSAKHQALQAN